ncbi:NADase-type glycan-binding domain-containing protein [Streptomyces caniscabiei]|uniref:Zinc ribbon domain-containing protein n=3 Tax=Streptomyces caniscabiei TaxID=2746961 RepID=A0A927QH04_9ACTN|nr:zinc ribbon domain-containing protein [Streptomyces caniscabiei]MBD9726748.1 zinc ribbon domain-containing protein [Streptomyces caniscabiei]MDX3723661.1 zinc ribbon domain-containing protein [Streptomyces caniscabiei]
MTSPTPGTGQAQSCAECGTRGEPGQSFCDACGAVLGWSGTGAARSEAAPATGDAPADGTRTPDAPPNRPASTVAPGPGQPSPEAPAPAPAGAAPAPAAAAATTPTPAGADRPATGGEPGWDAFAHPGAGTGTARTAHDTAPAAATGVRDPDPGTAARPDAPATATATTHHATAPAAPAAPEARTQPQPQIQPPVQPHPAAAPHPHPGDEDPTTPLPTHTSPAPAAPVPSAADRARSLLVPVADPEPRAPAEPAVAPVLPGRPDVQRPQVRAPQPEFGTEGGVPCPWCGTPTRPDRHFCARCAMPMAGRTEAPARLPWWRRVLTGRNTETPWAGDRPRLRRGFGQILSWLVGALVLTLIVTLAFQADDAYQATRDHFAKRASVVPDSFKASRSFPGHKPQLAFDTYSNTWWGPGVTQSGEGEWIEARFEEPTRLLDVVITPGVSKNADQRAESARPHRIEAKITAADGSVSTKTLVLDQSAGGQRRKFRVGEAETVRFTVLSAYGADAKKQVAIAEIEFFGRSGGTS